MKKFRLRDYLPVLIMVLCAAIFGVLLAAGVMDLDTVPQLVADRPVLAVLVVLAAALMIYALVWGDEAASRTFRASILRAVVVCSLGFYCLAKSYSFYTGANHLHSVISPGTPGRILSAGLILPLNVAVGFVVCCTMYSLYMYFRRGEL